MVETNHLWAASYLHEMLGSYIDSRSGERPYSRLYEETLLAADIVEMGILHCDDNFLEFVMKQPDAKASALYQVIRHFPDETVRSGAALMIELLTTASSERRFLPLTTGVLPDIPTISTDIDPALERMIAEMRLASTHLRS